MKARQFIFALLASATFIASSWAQDYELVTLAPNQEEPRNYPMGPISGQFRVTDGTPYGRIVSITPGGPGAAAGLAAGDFIFGAFGKPFLRTGYMANGEQRGFHHGVIQELGFAIDRAEGGDGTLPLTILRQGVGQIQVTVNLTPVGAYGPTFPINSAKYDTTYETAIKYIHDAVMANQSPYYVPGWWALALMGHPDWNQTEGARPYRLSINKLRDKFILAINNGNYTPTEDRLYDGTTNPNAAGGVSTWDHGQMVMVLAEYYQRTKNLVGEDAGMTLSVQAALQRGVEMSANLIQWWKQPNQMPAGVTPYSPESEYISGMSGHGGVGGDYIGVGWGGGLNMAGLHTFLSFSFAARVGTDMTARPIDGHYFGYSKAAFQSMQSTPGNGLYGIRVVPPGKELYDNTVQEKFLMQWNLLAYRNFAMSTPGDLDDGHVCYQFEGWNPNESVGKTAGTIVAMEMYVRDGGTLTTEDRSRLERMKLYVTRNYIRQMDSHAFCVGAMAMHTMVIPYLNDRSQRFILENWRYYHALGRDHTQRFQYVRARRTADNYIPEDGAMAVSVGLPGGLLRGNLLTVPGINRDRIVPRFDNPDMRWPDLDARYLEATAKTVSMPYAIVDGNGTVLNPSSYTATWSQVSGSGTADFSEPGQITFSQDGLYRVKLTVTRGAYVLEEPIDISIRSEPIPEGYLGGVANYAVYKNINGSTVNNLLAAASYPNTPDTLNTVAVARGSFSGDNYGSRLSGAFIPPVAGSYRFYIAANASAQLRINPDGLDPADGDVVASVASAVNVDQFNANVNQQSPAYDLIAGRPVSFEALHKASTGADHLSLGWSVNGGAITVISGAHLAAPSLSSSVMKIITQPQSVAANMGATVTLAITTTSHANMIFQWRRNGVPFGSPSVNPTLELANLSAGAEGWYDCVFTTLLGTLTSQAALVVVSDAGTTVAGGLWKEMYTGINGATIADLTAASKFPLSPDSSGPITSAATPSLGDSYGQRWTGWVTPDTTGNYRFYLTSDDDTEIWLSTDDTAANAVKIHAISSYTGVKQWSARAPSGYKSLVAGTKYYFEVRHKEGSGGDHCAVAWQREGTAAPTNGSGEISSAFLSYRLGGFIGDLPTTNVAPIFGQATYTLGSVRANVAYTGWTLSGMATDLNTRDTLTYSKDSGPSWLSVAANGALSGTPAVGDMGNNTFAVRVTDGAGLTATATVAITVLEANLSPSFTTNPIAKAAATVAVPYVGESLSDDATDPNVGDTLTFSKVSGPIWLTVFSNGDLGGNPGFANKGLNTFVVRVTDASGASVDATLQITVNADYYFDHNGVTAGAGISGSPLWTTTTSNWTANPNGTSATIPWLDGVDVIFSAGSDATGAYSILMVQEKKVSSLTVRSGQPTISSPINGILTLAANPTVFTVSSTAATISAPISFTSSANGLVKEGAGILTISGAGTYAGGTVVNQGKLVFNRTSSSGSSNGPGTGNITVNQNGTLANGSQQSIWGAKENQRTVTINGGTVDITAGQEFLYNLAMTGGSVVRGASSNLLRVGDQTNSGNITTFAAASSAVIATGVDLTFNNLTLTVAEGAAVSDLLISGVISETTGPRTLTKAGTGTVELSAANTYTGATAIDAGTLLVTNSSGSATGTGTLTIASGATLSGTGFVNGAVTVNGALIPGNQGIGTLRINNTLTLAATATSTFQINKNGSALTSDQIAGATAITVGGTLTVTATGDQLVENNVFTLFNVTPSGTFATVTLPTLPSYLSWQVNNNYRSIQILDNGTRTAQTINPFPTIAGQTFVPSTVNTVTITPPTATSGLTPSVTVQSGPATLSGNVLTITGPGTVVLAANQSGNATYSAAAEVTTSVVVAKAVQSISFASLAAYTGGNTTRTLVATASSGLPVSLATSNPAVATLSGTTLVVVGRGTTTITASQAGDSIYASAPNVAWPLSVAANITIAVNDSMTVLGTTPETINVLTNDLSGNGAITVQSVTQPANGTVTFTASSVTYTANASFTGTNTFTYTIVDAGSQTSTASVAVSVYPPNYWITLAGGSWATAANWSQNTVPSGIDALANFRQLDLTADATVSLNGARTIGHLLFADSTPTHAWTLATGTAGPLTLSVSSGMSAVTVVNSTATISAVLAGSDGLVKEGAGTLVLTGTNTYTGNTVINAGTLTTTQTRNGFNQSVFAGTITVNSGATLDMSNNPTGYGGGTTSIDVNGGTVTGTGGLGAFALAYNLTGGTITGTARIDLGSYNGVDGAINSLASSTTSVVNNTQGVRFRLDSGQSTYTFTTALGTTPSGIDLDITGALSQSASSAGIVKDGAGALALSGASSYTGPTSIANGTLLVNGSLNASSTVTVAAGGTLGGTGTVNGDVIVNGTLTPGIFGIGTLNTKKALTLAGTAAFGLNKSGSTRTSDQIAGATTITAGGTLTVTATGDTLTEGDTFTLFNITPGGTFAAVTLPTLPSYLSWQVNNNYRSIQILDNGTRTAQTINPFPTIAGQTFVPSTVNTVTITPPTTTSGLTPSVTVQSGPATLSGNVLTITGPGTVVLAANQAGNATYSAATEVTTSVVVAKAVQSISFASLTAYTGGNTTRTLVATASSGLPVSFASSNPAVATVSGTTLVIVGRGTATITASQAGDSIYASAPNVAWPVSVAGNITVAVIDSITVVGSAPETLNVLTNDLSGNGALTVQSITQPANGSVTFTASSVTYTPATNFTGSDSFTYTIVDAGSQTSTASVAVTVYPPNYWITLAGGSWGTAANWLQNTVPSGIDALANFRQLDLTANATVTLDGSRTIGTLLFADSTPTHDWTLATGTGGTLTMNVTSGMPAITVANRSTTISAVLAGAKGFVKEGSGTLVLSGTNTYAGGTVINAGTLSATQNRSGFNTSVYAGTITVNSGATLSMSNNPLGWGGGTTSIDINGGTLTGTGGLGVFALVYNLTGGTVTGTARLDLGSYNSINGAINSLASATTSVINTSGGVYFRLDSGQNTYTFTTALGTTTSGIDLDITSAIGQSATGSLVKDGAGTLALSGANSYTGATSIANGTLLVKGSLHASSTVTVAAGGTLGGTGTVNGNVIVNGTLSPGNFGIGTLTTKIGLTLAGTAEFGLNKNGSTLSSDQIAAATSITAGGTLTVTTTGDTLVAGDTFTLFNRAPTGTFAAVNLPTLSPSYFKWRTTNNYASIQVYDDRTPQTINAFPTIAGQTFVPGTVNTVTITPPTTTAGLTPIITVKSGSATISGNVVTFTAPGTIVLAANQSGDATYAAAAEVTANVVVAKAVQTISFDTVAAYTGGSTIRTLVATASSGLPVSFASGNPNIATVVDNNMVVVGRGLVTLTASQPGNNLYASASVTQDFTVASTTTVAKPDTMVVAPGSSGTVTVTTNDLNSTASITVQSVTQPANGVATFSGTSVTYTPNANYLWTDAFTYTIVDAIGGTSTAKVTANYPNPYDSLGFWWRMNEGSGTTTADSTGAVASRTANLINSPTWVAGRLGGGILFNGTSQYLTTITSGPNFSTTTTSTLSAWINPTATNGDRTIVSQAGSFSLKIRDGKLLFTTTLSSVVSEYLSNVSIGTNTWQHVAVTFQRITSTSWAVTFYLDGVLQQNLTTTTAISSTTAVWEVGRNGTAGQYFAGIMDEMRYYSRIQSAYEISEMAAGLPHGDPIVQVPDRTLVAEDAYAVFTVIGFGLQPVTLSLVDDGNVAKSIETSANGTSSWTAYTPGSPVRFGSSTGRTFVRTANTGSSSYTLTVRSSDGTLTSGTAALLRQANTIGAFATIPDQTYAPNKAVTITPPTASSGLSVAVTVKSGPATIAGNVVTLTGAGTVVLAANQAGNTTYSTAAEVTSSFAVDKATPLITWATPTAITYGTALSGTQLNATANAAGSFAYTPASGTVLAAGSQTLAVAFTPTNPGNYNPATGSVTLTVNKPDQTITFGTLADKTYGAAAFTVSASASSGLGVTFSIASGPATIDGNTITLTGVGTVTVTAAQAGNANYNAATSVNQSFAVAKATAPLAITPSSLSVVYNGTARSATATTTPAGLTVNFTYNGSATAPTNVGNYTVVGTISHANYQGTASGTLAIAKANQVVNIAPLPDTVPLKDLTASPVQVTATATSTLGVVLSVDGGSAAQLNGSNQLVSIQQTGLVTLRGNQPGDTNYNPAPEVVDTLDVVKSNQTITFATLANKTFGDAPFTLSATASPSSLTPTFSIVSGPATLSGTTLTITGAGDITVRASQAGDTTYNAASDVSRTFTVARRSQTITFPTVTARTYGDSAVTLGATASSTLAVTYSVVSGPATVSGSTLTLTGAGNVTVRASQSGDTNNSPATDADQTIAVAKKAITVSTTSGQTKVFGASDPTLAYTVTAGGLVGSDAFTGALARAVGESVGTYAIGQGTLALNASYTLTFVAANFSITPASATVALSAPSLSHTYDGTVKSATATTTPANLAVTFTYNGSGTAPTAAGTYTVVGTIGDANYQGSASASLVIAKATPIVTWATPDAIVYSTALSTTQLNATASVAGTFVYNPVAGTVLAAGSHTLTTTFTPTDTTNYNGATASVTLTVTTLPGYESWRFSKFTSGERADDNVSGFQALSYFDGIPNGAKYALGLEPKQAAMTGIPELVASGTEWRYTYNRPTSITDVTYEVEVSSDLTTWVTTGVTHEVVSTSGGVANWRGRFSPGTATSGYFRLKLQGEFDTTYMPPLGFATYVVPAGQTRVISLPILHQPVGSGAVYGRLTDVGTNYFESTGAGWTPGGYSSAASPYYLRLRSGPSAGRIFPVSTDISSTATRIYLASEESDLRTLGLTTGVSGDVYELVLADTLGSLFSPSVVQGGIDFRTADCVQVWGGASYLTFYYNTTRSRWERDSDTAASDSRNDYVLRSDRGIAIIRRGSTDLRLSIAGRVPEVAARYWHQRPGVTFLSTGVPTEITLSELALETRASAWTGGASYATAVSTADLISVWGGASWLHFYYDTTNSRWQRMDDASQTDRDNFVVPAGQPIVIRRITSGADAIIPLPLPYTISR